MHLIVVMISWLCPSRQPHLGGHFEPFLSLSLDDDNDDAAGLTTFPPAS